jgi:hypothetical protein
MNDLNRLNSIEKNLEKSKIEIEKDWQMREDENDILKRINARKIETEFAEIQNKEQMKLIAKKQSWFNKLINFFTK